MIPPQFLSRLRGVTYSLKTVGRTESGVQSTVTTTVRLRRSRNRPSIETLEWQPYERAGMMAAQSFGGAGEG